MKMNLSDKLPSGRKLDDAMWELHYTNVNKQAKSIVRSLLSKYGLTVDNTVDALAFMNHDTKSIVINEHQLCLQLDAYWDKTSRYQFREFMRRTYLGLICHEIGHAFYTLPPSESEKLYSGSCPAFFIHFCANVVEDSYIQKAFKSQFSWGLIKDAVDTSTAVFQGMQTAENFAQKTDFSIQDKLFYFILKSYNPYITMPAALGIPQELEDEFLSFYYHPDNKERFIRTTIWAEKLYDLLKQDVQKPTPPGGSPGTPDDSQDPQGPSDPNAPHNPNAKGKNSNTLTPEEVEAAIKDIIDNLSKQTGIGNGKTIGDFDKSNQKSMDISVKTELSSNITRAVKPSTGLPFDDLFNKLLHDYNLNFRRLQLHTFNGIAYNQTKGKLYTPKIYKSSLTPKIFTREIGNKRDMDLYFNIIIDMSGSMDATYPLLIDMVTPLLYSLESLNSKSEALLFSNDTVKLKDYHDHNIKDLYGTARKTFQGGGTDLLPALLYTFNVVKQRLHKDKCVIVVTDGQTDNHEECKQLIQGLKRLNVSVLGIGLRLGSYDLKCCQELFGQDLLTYDSDEDMAARLAGDLITFLISKFMRR